MNSPDSPREAAPVDDLPAVAPDQLEQVLQNEIDNIVPTRGYQMMPMVGLGGSAGAMRPLTEFFRSMPADTGMVFVVILHLSPDYESSLPQLLARATSMKVAKAVDGQRVEANHVYVIPPGKHLITVDGHLCLVDLKTERGTRVAVDLFFRSLADTHGPHAAAIVLSGADADGALGIKRIKERGGLTIAQDPREAEHASMPQASINTGMVDWVLQVSEIPERLVRYRDHEFRLKLPPEEEPAPVTAAPVVSDGEAALREVLDYLRTRTGCDFSYYKRATIVRRIARRMQVNGVEDVPGYLEFIRTHQAEAGALMQDLLISVTNFFRDREAFQALEQHIPELFRDKGPVDTIRVWVPACATGEEAYSIAMLLLEHAQTLDSPPSLQIFACDLDFGAIQLARAGHYPETMAADVSEERLRRFFVKNHAGYRVRRELREMVLIATHDLLRDAPFSRMDLVSCRNLLIYLNLEAQERALEIFHFALQPEGLLFLGVSESVDESSPLFQVVDKKYRIFARGEAPRAISVLSGPTALQRIIEAQDGSHLDPVVHGKRFVQEAVRAFPPPLRQNFDKETLAELHFRLIERLAPPSVIVDDQHELMHISEHAGEFLQITGGEPSTNLLRLVHPMLRVELRAALFRATEENQTVDVPGVPVETNGEAGLVDLRVAPAPDIAPGVTLIIFSKRAADEQLNSMNPAPATTSEPMIRHLERELEQVKGRLRDTVEQYEASTEELKASNEELQAMNEELRSATEELETSREELQSINEELTTVNQEMKLKMDEIANANSDLQNLMASTSIATVFLDRDLAITRYTPTAVDLFHLIPSDLGRPLAHLKHRLEYPGLISDAEQVLRQLTPVEREVRCDNDWFLARIQPYRKLEDQIGGVVLTFVNISDRRRATEALREQLVELERFNAVAVGRESRMIELKQEINSLCGQLGELPRYKVEVDP